MQFIVFRTAKEEFGITIDTVREIIKMCVVTPIPKSPDFIKGIVNVRGEIVTAIDIKTHLMLKDESVGEPRHIIVIKQSDCLFGLIVDEVIEIIRIKKDMIQQPFIMDGHRHREHVMGFDRVIGCHQNYFLAKFT